MTVGIAVFLLVTVAAVEVAAAAPAAVAALVGGLCAGSGAGGGLSFRLLLAEAEGMGLFPALPVYAFLLPRRGVVGKGGTTGEGAGAGAGTSTASLVAAVTLLVVTLLVEPPLADTPCPSLRFKRGTGALAVVAVSSLVLLAGGLTLCLPSSTFLFLCCCNVVALLEAVTSCRSPFCGDGEEAGEDSGETVGLRAVSALMKSL